VTSFVGKTGLRQARPWRGRFATITSVGSSPPPKGVGKNLRRYPAKRSRRCPDRYYLPEDIAPQAEETPATQPQGGQDTFITVERIRVAVSRSPIGTNRYGYLEQPYRYQ
jgi:hypothetical protein